jgi:hypothetical protein
LRTPVHRRAAENAEKNAEKTKPNKTELRNVAAALSSPECAEEAEGAEPKRVSGETRTLTAD